MIKNIFICDRCGEEQENGGRQMWYVGAYIGSYEYGSKEVSKPSDSQLWCRRCVIETGFMVRTKEGDVAITPTPEPTLEDKLRHFIAEIVHEEIGQ